MLSVTLISCVPGCFMNREKENERILCSVNLIKGIRHFFLSFFLSLRYQIFTKELITARNLTHYKEFITALISLYLKMKKTCLYQKTSKTTFILFLFISIRLSCIHFFSCIHSSQPSYLRHPSLVLNTWSVFAR